MNGCRYLNPSLSPELTYIPICQATGEVCFPTLHNYAVSPNAPRPQLLNALKREFEDAKRSYDAIKSRESILSESISLMERWGAEKYECAASL
jgi:hypothetical protein